MKSLPLRRAEPAGTDNAVFRLGAELAVRLARRGGPTEPGGKEHDWLPRLAPLLPLAIPVPVAQGRPSGTYPWFWDVVAWVEGETVPVDEIDAIRAAHDLATFVAALHVLDPTGAPPGRGIPLAERDQAFRPYLARFDGDPRVTTAWERAVAAPAWDGPPTWHHGDLDARNWVVRDGHIAGVIDWGCMGVGDPACDVARVLTESVAAVSAGIVDGEVLLDLNYEEDSRAEVDLNVVLTGAGEFVEIQGTAERGTFSDAQLSAMLGVAKIGLERLRAVQREALGAE